MSVDGFRGQGVEAPIRTMTGKNGHAVVAPCLVRHFGNSDGAGVDAPAPTVMAGGQHLGEVRAFLVKYYGTGVGQSLKEPAHTLTAKARLGLVMVKGVEYQIVDIGLRMLQPRELARAQGFPDSYVLEGTKTKQVALIGNSVAPPLSEALARANYAGCVEAVA